MAGKSKGDKVGKGHPPKHSQFKKGKSGNPAGRPKGSKNLKSLVNQLLGQKVPVVQNGQKMQIPMKQLLLTSLFSKAADEFHEKTTRPNQLWQSDFTYLKVIGWGWFYLSTILDDYSRYIVAWRICTTMRAGDVTSTPEDALAASGCDSATVAHRPRLLSDKGSSYISGGLAEWLEQHGMDHIRGAPNHPQTQGKIERWHQTLKNRILLENYYLPGALEEAIGSFE